MSGVIGGWAVVILVFSVAALLGLTVRRRAEEFALLRRLGGTRRQVGGPVLREAVGVAVLAGALGGAARLAVRPRRPPAVPGRREVAADVEHRIG